jgi:hydroxymethylbilane synthase
MIRVGTRSSALARWQTDEILRLWRSTREVAIVDVRTTGDEQAEAPLHRMEGIGFFTSAIERALLERRIDAAVHSYKDLPVAATPGLCIAAVPARGPVEDVLCARDGLTLARLAPGARVGTSSVRRTAQVKALRPDLVVVPVRGNVDTRIASVRWGSLDAVVLARAGVERLGLGAAITEVFALDRILTAPAQGALAVQVRADDHALVRELAGFEHALTRRAVEAERAVLHALRGGCSVPVGAFARASGAGVALEAGVFDPAGTRALRARVEAADAESAGREAAQRLLEAGAAEILDALEREPRVTGGLR